MTQWLYMRWAMHNEDTAALYGPMQALSYYKIFGYPTGLGALLARKEALRMLRKRYFGGGAVAVSVADRNFFRCVPRLTSYVFRYVFLPRTMHDLSLYGGTCMP